MRARAREVLRDAHPLAWLLLLAVALFSIQPFRYDPKFLLFFTLRYALFVPAILWGLALLVLCCAVWARKKMSMSKEGANSFAPGTSILKSRLAQGSYWRDFFWSYWAIFLILDCHFLVKVSIHAINPRLFDSVLEIYDRWLFFGHDPVHFFLGLAKGRPLLLHAIDTIYNAVYYFTFMVSVPALALLAPKRRQRLSFAIAYSLIWIVGGAMYVALPSWGPTFCDHKPFEEALRFMPTVNYVQGIMAKGLTQLLDDPYASRTLSFGGVAAFPSLHIAVMTVFTLMSMKVSKVWGSFNLAVAACMFVGSMVTGYHYLSDGIAGIVLGSASVVLALRWADFFIGDSQGLSAGTTIIDHGPAPGEVDSRGFK